MKTWKKIVLGVSLTSLFLGGGLAVSYTHLDVYKRQIYIYIRCQWFWKINTIKMYVRSIATKSRKG